MDFEHFSPEGERLRAGIAARLRGKRPATLATLAQEFSISELAAAQALPVEMRRLAPADSFDSLWNGLTAWERATFIVQFMGTVIEVRGRIPFGTHGHGFFNLAEGFGLGGHIKVDDLKGIVFLSMPFMGLESHSLQFFNTRGAVKFSVYAGREGHAIISSVRDAFFRMRDAYCEDTDW